MHPKRHRIPTPRNQEKRSTQESRFRHFQQRSHSPRRQVHQHCQHCWRQTLQQKQHPPVFGELPTQVTFVGLILKPYQQPEQDRSKGSNRTRACTHCCDWDCVKRNPGVVDLSLYWWPGQYWAWGVVKSEWRKQETLRRTCRSSQSP